MNTPTVATTKSINDHFRDWEAHVFGFGYGTGEDYVIPAMKTFLSMCVNNPDGSGTCYNHEEISKAVTPAVTWLLINTLCHADIIEYGSSPRFGWLTDTGLSLRDYVATKTNEELIEIVMAESDRPSCFPDLCQCDIECNNPFWKKRNRSSSDDRYEVVRGARREDQANHCIAAIQRRRHQGR